MCFTKGNIPRGKNAGMPPELFNIYLRYKQDTRAVLAWFLSHRHTTIDSSLIANQLSVRDLARIALELCKIPVIMPATIEYQFKEMIRARYLMSQFFKKAESLQADGAQISAKATEDHEFFTMSLTKIYDDLCSCCKAPVEDCSCNESCEIQDQGHDNQYSALSATTEEDHSDEEYGDSNATFHSVDTNADLESRQDETYWEDQKTSPPKEVEEKPPLPTLVGDDLGDTFDIWDQVQQMQDIFFEVEAIWAEVARGITNLVTATAVTSAAFTLLEPLEHRLIHDHGIKDPYALQRATQSLTQQLDPSLNSSSTSHLIMHLSGSWQSMLDLRSNCWQPGFEEEIKSKKLPPSVVFSPGGEDIAQRDKKCRALMLSNIALTVVNKHLHNVFVRGGSAGCAEVGWFISHKDLDPANCMHCSSALFLLLVSYKAYSFALPASQTPSVCRVQCLSFAQEGLKWIKAVLDDSTMPCRCRGTLAYHLENLKEDFASYLRTRLFDVYFQNPWVCGGHVLEMMHALRYYGLRLLAYKSYVGGVVHVYNVLRRLGECCEILVLEELCVHFESLFFPGGRPDRAYKNSYVRYLGGRLRFHGSAFHQNGCHELAIPAHAARATAGFGTGGSGGTRDSNFDCSRLSVLFRAKKDEFYFSEQQSNIAECAKREKPLTGWASRHEDSETSHSRSCSTDSATTYPSYNITRLENLRIELEEELRPKFPNSRLNFFAFYLDCAHAVDMISDQYHDEDQNLGQHCLCFAENLLATADGGREAKGWRKQTRELLQICGDVIKLKFGGKSMEDLAYYGLEHER